MARKKEPLLVFSPLTGQVYIATRYHVKIIKGGTREVLVTDEKFDVTEQFFAVRDQRERWLNEKHPPAELPG